MDETGEPPLVSINKEDQPTRTMSDRHPRFTKDYDSGYASHPTSMHHHVTPGPNHFYANEREEVDHNSDDDGDQKQPSYPQIASTLLVEEGPEPASPRVVVEWEIDGVPSDRRIVRYKSDDVTSLLKHTLMAFGMKFEDICFAELFLQWNGSKIYIKDNSDMHLLDESKVLTLSFANLDRLQPEGDGTELKDEMLEGRDYSHHRTINVRVQLPFDFQDYQQREYPAGEYPLYLDRTNDGMPLDDLAKWILDEVTRKLGGNTLGPLYDLIVINPVTFKAIGNHSAGNKYFPIHTHSVLNSGDLIYVMIRHQMDYSMCHNIVLAFGPENTVVDQRALHGTSEKRALKEFEMKSVVRMFQCRGDESEYKEGVIQSSHNDYITTKLYYVVAFEDDEGFPYFVNIDHQDMIDDKYYKILTQDEAKLDAMATAQSEADPPEALVESSRIASQDIPITSIVGGYTPAGVSQLTVSTATLSAESQQSRSKRRRRNDPVAAPAQDPVAAPSQAPGAVPPVAAPAQAPGAVPPVAAPAQAPGAQLMLKPQDLWCKVFYIADRRNLKPIDATPWSDMTKPIPIRDLNFELFDPRDQKTLDPLAHVTMDRISDGTNRKNFMAIFRDDQVHRFTNDRAPPSGHNPRGGRRGQNENQIGGLKSEDPLTG